MTRQLLKRIAELERSAAALPAEKELTISSYAIGPFAAPYEQWANEVRVPKKAFWPHTPPWAGESKFNVFRPEALLKTYGERYRHPSNLTLELSCIYDLRYVFYENTLSWYDHMLPNLGIDELVSDTEKIEQLSPGARGELDRRKKGLAFLGCNDRFFLLTRLCGRKDANHPLAV